MTTTCTSRGSGTHVSFTEVFEFTVDELDIERSFEVMMLHLRLVCDVHTFVFPNPLY